MPRLKIKRVSIHNMNSTAVLNQFSSDNIHHNKALRQTNFQEIIVEKSFKNRLLKSTVINCIKFCNSHFLIVTATLTLNQTII